MHFRRLKIIVELEQYPKMLHLIKAIFLGLGLLVIGYFLQFIMNMVFTHNLTTSDYGDYNLITNTIFFVGIIFLLGNDQASIKFIPDYFTQKKSELLHGIFIYYARWWWWMMVCVCILGVAIAVWVRRYHSGAHLIWQYLWMIPFSALVNLLGMLLRSRNQGFYSLLTLHVLPPVFLIGAIEMVHYIHHQSITLNEMMWIFLIANLLLVIFVQLMSLYRVIPWEVFKISPQFFNKTWFLVGVQLILGMLIYDGESSIVNITLKLTGHSSAEVGIFSVCMVFFSAMWLTYSACAAVFNPLIEPIMVAKDTARLQILNNMGNATMLGVGAIIFILLLSFGKVFLSWFGADYVQGYSTLLILCGGSLLGLAIGMSTPLLEYTLDDKILMKLTLICSFFIVLAGIPLCKYWGIIGGAIEILLVEVGIAFIYAIKLKQILHIKPFLFF